MTVQDQLSSTRSQDTASEEDKKLCPRFYSVDWPVDEATGNCSPRLQLEALGNSNGLEEISSDLRIFEMGW